MFALCYRPRKRGEALGDAPFPTVSVVPPVMGLGGGHFGRTRQREAASPETGRWTGSSEAACPLQWFGCTFYFKSQQIHYFHIQIGLSPPRTNFWLSDKSSLSAICPHPGSVRTTGRLNHQIYCCRAFPEACLEATFLQEWFREPGRLVVLQPLSLGEGKRQAPGHTHTRAALGVSSPGVTQLRTSLRSRSLTAVWAPAQRASLRGARAALLEWPSLSRPQPFSVLPSPQSPAPCGLCLVFLGSGCSVTKHGLRPLFLSPFLYHKPCARNRSQWEKTFQNIYCFLFNLRNVTFGFKRKSIFL